MCTGKLVRRKLDLLERMHKDCNRYEEQGRSEQSAFSFYTNATPRTFNFR